MVRISNAGAKWSNCSPGWRGLPYALRELRRYPRLAPYVRRVLGRPPSREEN
jgi:hypothetical protein